MEIKTVLLIIFLIILSLAGFGYLRAIPTPNVQDNYPQIEISPTSFDFGEVEYGEVLKHDFVIRNFGNAVLEIKRVATSCACTTAKVAKEIINPGEETSVSVSYDTGAMSGPHGKGDQNRIIFIQTNDPINTQVDINISAIVK